MILIADKKSDYRIVISENADAAVQNAASELAKYLELMGGVKLPIVSDAVQEQAKEIVIGKTNREGTPCGSNLKNDGYIWKTVGEKLFILGENGRGNLYGVYQLLEDVLGCRFYTASFEKVPSRSVVELPELDETRISPFEYRNVYWYEVQADQEFAVKRGTNAVSYDEPFDEAHGGSIQYNGFVHTFKLYIPDDEFFETHPEYFCMVNGKRQPGHYAQLCLTNPDVFNIMLERALKSIAEHPKCSIISLSQNDGFNPCTCPECAKVDAEEGGYSGTLIRFVNALAREIGKVYPDITVDTLAYRHTRQAPLLTKPEPNICVRMCTIECCFSHPIAECVDESNAAKVDDKETTTMQEDFEAWGKICKRMFVWDYTTNFWHYLAPFPNLHVLQRNIQYFLRQNVTGLFEQGNAQSVSGEFGELRAYLISKLMWEPDGDVNSWMEDFLKAYYGCSADAVREYIDLLRNYVEEENVHVGIYNMPGTYLPVWLLDKAAVIWDKAEAAAENETVLERVQRSRLQLTYAQLHQMSVEDPARAEKMEGFVRDIHRFGITRTAEGRNLELCLERLAAGDLTVQEKERT